MSETYVLSEREMKAVLALAGRDRYDHLVKRVADWQSVWSLRDESGWVSAADDQGRFSFPIWPHPSYASACATGEWANNEPVPIDVHAFAEEWLPNMASRGVRLAVFPTVTSKAVFVEAAAFLERLSQELSQYE